MAEYTPKNRFAGPFPVAVDYGKAEEAIIEMTPITSEMKPVAGGGSATYEKVIGLAAADAAKGEEVTFYCTGEFHEEAINLPEEVTMDDIRSHLRKLNIYIR